MVVREGADHFTDLQMLLVEVERVVHLTGVGGQPHAGARRAGKVVTRTPAGARLNGPKVLVSAGAGQTRVRATMYQRPWARITVRNGSAYFSSFCGPTPGTESIAAGVSGRRVAKAASVESGNTMYAGLPAAS